MRLRHILKTLVFSLIPLLMLLLVGEVVARIVCHYKFDRYSTSLDIQGNGAFADNFFTVWTNRARYLYPDASFSYNDYGMRVAPGDVVFPDKQDNDFYVFLLGGSAMAGMGSNLNGDWVKITGVGTHPIETAIDGYLEKKLQAAMPDKRVKVFNAAVASHTIAQTRMQYELLKHLKPDWIVSMDGINDDIFDFTAGRSQYQQLVDAWKRNPVNNAPFVQGRFFMRNSALCYLVGEFVFFRTGIMRNKINSSQDPQVFEKWLAQKTVPGAPEPEDAKTTAKVQRYIANTRDFEALLDADNQRHLILLQPETSMRDPTTIANPIEMAVYNYNFSGQIATPHAFMHALQQTMAREFAGSSTVFSMDTLHRSWAWIFVDYCHFSAEANALIADEIAAYILSGGTSQPFSAVSRN